MKYNNFSEFYPYYLSQHTNEMCRRLHVVGSLLAVLFFLYFLFTFKILALILAIVCAYGFAWIGHTYFEKNKPTTLEYPLYSFFGDWVMLKEILTGKIKF